LEETSTIDDFLPIEESTSIEQMPMFEGISNNTLIVVIHYDCINENMVLVM